MLDQAVSMAMSGLVTFVVAATLCAILLTMSAKVASHYGLVDKPTDRKRHEGNIPLVGGLAIFITYAALNFNSANGLTVILAGGLLLLVGMADDFKELSAKLRLLFQLAGAGILVIAGQNQIYTIGTLLGSEPLIFGGVVSIVFSVVCVAGVINATNMIDGVDGLAGGIIAISLTALFILVSIAGGPDAHISELLSIIGAIGAFLLFNTGLFGTRHRVFLGDSGTMFLGILLACYYISFSQGENPYMAPVVAGWIFGLPLMDSIAVIVGRLLRRSSPFRSGRDHLHHLLIDSGIAKNTCVLVMLCSHAILVVVGLIGSHFSFSSSSMFWAFVVLVIAHYFITPRLVTHFCSKPISLKPASK